MTNVVNQTRIKSVQAVLGQEILESFCVVRANDSRENIRLLMEQWIEIRTIVDEGREIWVEERWGLGYLDDGLSWG